MEVDLRPSDLTDQGITVKVSFGFVPSNRVGQRCGDFFYVEVKIISKCMPKSILIACTIVGIKIQM